MRRVDLFIILSAIYLAPTVSHTFAVIASILFAIFGVVFAFLPEQRK